MDGKVAEQLDDSAALFWLNKQLASAPAQPTDGSAKGPLRAHSFQDLADGHLLLVLVRRPRSRTTNNPPDAPGVGNPNAPVGLAGSVCPGACAGPFPREREGSGLAGRVVSTRPSRGCVT